MEATTMPLTDEQQDMLNGKQGKEMGMALRTLIEMGKHLGATKLVPVTRCHITGSFAISAFKGYYELLDRMVAAGLRVKVPTTCNPHPGKSFATQNRQQFKGDAHHQECFKKLGVIQNWSCISYYNENVPEFGDICGFGESSVVVMTNSMIGSRSNIWGVFMDFCQAVTGFTPYFGLLLDENRFAQMVFDISGIKKMDCDALGLFVGKTAVDKTPVLTHYPFDKFQLKHLFPAMASAGGVRVAHVEGLTPEAPDLATALGGKQPIKTVKVTQKDIDAFRAPQKVVKDCGMVVFGCPQTTFEEATELGKYFVGKTVKVRTLICMPPLDLTRFKQYEIYEDMLDAGVEFWPMCPLTALTVRVKKEYKNILTCTGKLHWYCEGAQYGTEEDCLRHAGVLD